MGNTQSSRRLGNQSAKGIAMPLRGYGNFRTFSSEVKPYGLKTLHDPNAAIVDVIFIHGLTGHREKTWTHKNATEPWPKALLPKRIPQARIMAFGYDARPTHWWKLVSENRLEDHSSTLLHNLANIRDADSTNDRPLIFVSHSLGGLVCQEALIRSRNSADEHQEQILKSTRGLMFLGTPHHGVDIADVVQTVASLVGWVKQVNKDITSVLRTSSNELAKIQDNFHNILRRYRSISVECVFEELPVSCGVSKMVVPKLSAGIRGRSHFGIHADHINMTKFLEEDDPGFSAIATALQRVVNKIREPQGYEEPKDENSTNVIYSVPQRLGSIFVGRTDLFQRLENSLPPTSVGDKQRCVVLHGLSGHGKTKIAWKFAETFRDRYWGVFWIDASSQRSAEKDFKNIARDANVDESVEAVKNWLSHLAKPWLLIIDSADDHDHDVTRYLPSSSYGHILITSRDPSCAMRNRTAAHEIEVMDPEEGKELLLKASNTTVDSGGNDEAAEKIVREVGAHPLALVHAAAAMKENHSSLGTYLDRYLSHQRERLQKRFMDGVRSHDYRDAVYTTWEISFKNIESMQTVESRNAIEMMNIFAFLHYDSIPVDIFERAWRGLSAISLTRRQNLKTLGVLKQGSQQWNPHPVLDGLQILTAHSLLEREVDGGKDMVCTHRLVHKWAHDRLSHEERERFMGLATELLVESIPVGNDDESSAYRKTLMPHIYYCLRSDENKDFWFESEYSEHWHLDYAAKFALVYNEFGHFHETEKLQQRILRGCQLLLGPEARKTLKSAADLANTFRRQGRLDKARKLLVDIIRSMESALGQKDRDTLTAKCRLADTYLDQGLWREAAGLEKQVMEDRTKVLGPNDADTLKATADLAKTYRRLGDFENAKLLQQQVLERSGENSIDALKVKGQLADTYRDQGLWDEAASLEKEVIEALEKVVSKDHPHLLIAKGDLAASFLGKEQWNDAERVLEEVVVAMDQVLGDKHPHKLKMAAKLAVAYRGQGRLEDACSLLLEVVSQMEELEAVLTKDHPDLLRAKGYLVDTYKDMGRLDDAEELGKVTLESARRVMGHDHPYTREIALALEDTYRQREKLGDRYTLSI